MVTMHVLLIAPAGSYRVGDHLDAAGHLGCEVTVVTDAAVAIAGSAIVVDLADPTGAATAALAAVDRDIDCVVGTDGAAVAVAGEIARRLRLPANTSAALAAAANKLAQRRAVAASGVLQPQFAVDEPDVLPSRPPGAGPPGAATDDPDDPPSRQAEVGPAATDDPDDPPSRQAGVGPAATDDPDVPPSRQAGAGRAGGAADDPELLLPAVVKPVDRAASQGVMRADTPAQLHAAIARVRRLVGATAPVLIERFVPGREVAVDGLLRDGDLQVLAVFDKPDTPSGPTFPETLLICPARLHDDLRRSVVDVVRRAVRAIGLTEGPIHAECKIDGDDVWFLELAARSIGGLCSRSLQFAGLSVEELALRHALDMPVPSVDLDGAVGVLMLPVATAGRLVAVRGVERAAAVDGIADVVISTGPGESVVPLPDGDRYLGFVFARSTTPDGCERALRRAWAELAVEIDTQIDADTDTTSTSVDAGDQRLVGGK